MGANLLTLSSFVIMLLVPRVWINPWIPTGVLGTGFAVLACALWPMISFLVPQAKLGTAYGVMQGIQNRKY